MCDKAAWLDGRCYVTPALGPGIRKLALAQAAADLDQSRNATMD